MIEIRDGDKNVTHHTNKLTLVTRNGISPTLPAIHFTPLYLTFTIPYITSLYIYILYRPREERKNIAGYPDGRKRLVEETRTLSERQIICGPEMVTAKAKIYGETEARGRLKSVKLHSNFPQKIQNREIAQT